MATSQNISRVPLSIECLNKAQFIDNEHLLTELEEIVAHSYVDVRPLLYGDASRCNRLYLGRAGNELKAFFFVSHEVLTIASEVFFSAFLGFSGAALDIQTTGSIWPVYEQAIADIKIREERNREQATIWYTTATPSAYYAMQRLYGMLNPSLDGEISEAAKAVTEAIRAVWYPMATVGQHPSVLKAVARVRYSEEERKRIQTLKTRKGFDLFERLDIRETDGDRLLVIVQSSLEQRLTNGHDA